MKPGAPEPSRPYVLHAGDGWTYGFGPAFIVKAGETGRGRKLAFVEFTTRRGEEPADHVHRTEDEIFYVLHGAIIVRCGEETFDLDDGGFVFLPRGIRHGYTIRSEGDVRMLVVTSPADEDAVGGWGGLIGDLESEAEGASAT